MRRLFCTALAAATLLAMAAPAFAATIPVGRDRVDKDWFIADYRGSAHADFVATYGGVNSPSALEMSTGNGNDKVQFLTTAHSGTKLADITAMSYATYRHSGSTGFAAGLPGLNLRVDRDNDNVVDTYMIYEPYMDFGNDAVVNHVWQTWDAYRGGAGTWWFSHPLTSGCGQATPCTWAAIVALYPEARILEDPYSPVNSGASMGRPLHGSFGVNLGSGNPGITAVVDALSIGVSGTTTTYDFTSSITFTEVRTQLDGVVADGGITPALEGKVRNALDMAQEWLASHKHASRAVTHLDRAISLIEWQIEVIAKGKDQGDPVALRALADSLIQLAAQYR